VGTLVGPGGQDVLDIGCGTGIVARLFAARGCRVLGVEPDARMAAVARRNGTRVEVSTFEEWDSAGRAFDLVVSGQAWHWVDPELGAAKAATVLRSGGMLAAFWNSGRPPQSVAAAFDEIYARIAPGIDGHSVVLGHGTGDRFDVAVDGIDRTGLFEPVTRATYTWAKRYTREEWVDHLPTHSDHQTLPTSQLDQLLGAVGDAIDEQGGSFTMAYDTVVISASRAASSAGRK
jgi:SAM-dependent methyltransferase